MAGISRVPKIHVKGRNSESNNHVDSGSSELPYANRGIARQRGPDSDHNWGFPTRNRNEPSLPFFGSVSLINISFGRQFHQILNPVLS